MGRSHLQRFAAQRAQVRVGKADVAVPIGAVRARAIPRWGNQHVGRSIQTGIYINHEDFASSPW